MILYAKQPLPISMLNMMMLEDKEGYVYLNKVTYDAAHALMIRHEDAERAINAFDGSWRSLEVATNILDFIKTAPEPVNYLAHALTYLANKGIDLDVASREDIYGYIHVVSQMLDLNNITLIPKEARAKIDVPTYSLKNYKDSWNSILGTLKDYTVENFVNKVLEEVDKTVEAKIDEAVSKIKLPEPQVVIKEVVKEEPVKEVTKAEPVKEEKEEPKKVEVKDGEKKQESVEDIEAELARIEKEVEEERKKKEQNKNNNQGPSRESVIAGRQIINGHNVAGYDKEAASYTVSAIEDFTNI